MKTLKAKSSLPTIIKTINAKQKTFEIADIHTMLFKCKDNKEFDAVIEKKG